MRTSLKVRNIQCGSCVRTIQLQLSDVSYLSEVVADKNTGMVSFSHNETQNLDEIPEILSEIGFPIV